MSFSSRNIAGRLALLLSLFAFIFGGKLLRIERYGSDLPYWDHGDGAPPLVVPYALDTNDMKFFHPNGFVRAREMVEYVCDALDVLGAEAERGRPRLLNLGFHLRIVGRPARFPALAGVLAALAARRDRLWIATRADIARAFAAAVPPDQVRPLDR